MFKKNRKFDSLKSIIIIALACSTAAQGAIYVNWANVSGDLVISYSGSIDNWSLGGTPTNLSANTTLLENGNGMHSLNGPVGVLFLGDSTTGNWYTGTSLTEGIVSGDSFGRSGYSAWIYMPQNYVDGAEINGSLTFVGEGARVDTDFVAMTHNLNLGPGDNLINFGIPPLDPVDLISLQQAFRVQDLIPQLTNVTLNGAHHRLLMDSAPGKDGWHMWATGDYANFNEINATQSVSELGFSKSLYEDSIRLGLGLGYTVADQDAPFGGGSKIDGDFLVFDGNYRIPNSKFIFSSLFYYGSFEAETSRGYLLGGAKSIGETDVESMAARLRVDWKDAYKCMDVSITPRLSYTYADTSADAYAETGGATPANFAEQNSKDHEFRLGADLDYALTEKTQLRTMIEVVYRATDGDNLIGNAGATAFNLENEDLNDTWGRLGFELLHQFNDSINAHVSVFGSTEGQDATLSTAIGVNLSF